MIPFFGPLRFRANEWPIAGSGWYSRKPSRLVLRRGKVPPGPAVQVSFRSILDIHHTPQKALAQDLVPGYPPVPSDDAPALALPHDEHVQVNIAQRRWMTAYRNGEVAGGLTDRDLLARDIRMLRTYTNAPNSALQELIRLNKAMYVCQGAVTVR